MKNTLLIITAITSILATSSMAQDMGKKVALKIPAETPARYVTMVPHGGLSISGTEIAARQVFTLVDTNDGDLADGDDVQFKYVDGEVTNYWYETTEGKVARIVKPTDELTTLFKVKKNAAGITLQTNSGKFVVATSKIDPLAVTDTIEQATVFEVIENPTVKEAKVSTEPKATETPKQTGETK